MFVHHVEALAASGAFRAALGGGLGRLSGALAVLAGQPQGASTSFPGNGALQAP